MKPKTVPVVFNRVGACYAGSGTYRGLPLDVRDFDRLVVHTWRGLLNGSGSSFSLVFEQSTDKNTWFPDIQTIEPPEYTEATHTILLSHRYLRWTLVLGGTDVMVSCRFHGDLYRRGKGL
ncbi:MAG: hypothetical protein ACT4PV_10515 [Planctomycetaceae bacterium]